MTALKLDMPQTEQEWVMVYHARAYFELLMQPLGMMVESNGEKRFFQWTRFIPAHKEVLDEINRVIAEKLGLPNDRHLSYGHPLYRGDSHEETQG